MLNVRENSRFSGKIRYFVRTVEKIVEKQGQMDAKSDKIFVFKAGICGLILRFLRFFDMIVTMKNSRLREKTRTLKPKNN